MSRRKLNIRPLLLSLFEQKGTDKLYIEANGQKVSMLMPNLTLYDDKMAVDFSCGRDGLPSALIDLGKRLDNGVHPVLPVTYGFCTHDDPTCFAIRYITTVEPDELTGLNEGGIKLVLIAGFDFAKELEEVLTPELMIKLLVFKTDQYYDRILNEDGVEWGIQDIITKQDYDQFLQIQSSYSALIEPA